MLHKRGIKTLFLSVLVAIGLLGASLGFLVFTTQAPTAVAQAITQSTDPFATAWELVEQSNTYRFDTHIEQTSYPVPALGNVGRQPQTDNVYLTGRRDRQQDLLELTLWQNARGDANSGLAVRSQNGRTYSRNAAGEWEERDGFSELFAPGGDPLTFMQTATNIRALGADSRELGGLTFSYQRYQFDLDTTAYARVMHRHLEAQLSQTGRLPAGMTLETPEVYRQMEGSGQVWLDDAGLPRRLEMVLEIPPQRDQGRVTARIVTDLSGFDRERIETTAVSFWQSPSTWVQVRQAEIAAGVGQATQTAVWLLLGVGFLLLFLTTWRSHRFYIAVASAVIVSMLVTPLLQGVQAGAFFDTLQARQTEAAQRQASASAAAEMQEELRATDWDPHQNPVSDSTGVAERRATTDAVYSPAAMPALAAANTITDTTDTDGDGLLDVDEAAWGTCPYLGAPEGCKDVTDATDTDGDSLSDGVEVHELGTNPDNADTDLDSIPDNLEVSGFTYNGQDWYLNPLEEDTNKDGVIDGLECRVRTTIVPSEFDPAGICPDTDADGTPDIFDTDDDGDGVHDAQDLSPFTASAGFYGEDTPLDVSFDNLALDKPVFVDFQVRPQTDSNLLLYNHVLDWPSQDGQGQIQRVLDTTWADTANMDLRSDSPNAANGDIRLVPMLEITMPYTDGHYANLPITTTAPVPRTLDDPVDNWLDSSQLEPFGISVNDKPQSQGTLNAYLPVTQVTDRYGTPEAFSARMMYRPSQGVNGRADWGAAHEVRLVWLVQMITDQCPDGYDDIREDGVSCRNPETGATAAREDVLTVGHIYQDTWQLTGLDVSEEHDFDLAIMYEDPALDTDLTSDDQLLVTSWNLNSGFLLGRDCDSKDGQGVCVGDGERDVTVENMATAVSSWFTDTFYINTQTYLDYDHSAYLSYLISTEVEPLLSTAFGSYTTTLPTLMYAHDITNRKLNLDAFTTDNSAGLVTTDNDAYHFDLKPADVVTQTLSTVSWTPYQRVSGEWQAADIESYLTRLDSRLQSETYFQPEDDTESAAEEAEQRRAWVQLYYTALWQGVSSPTATAGQALHTRPADPDIPDAFYDPLFLPGTDFGATILAQLFFSTRGTLLFTSKPYMLITVVTWAALGLLFFGNEQQQRTAQIILAVVNLIVATIYAVYAIVSLIAFGLSGGTKFPAMGPVGLLIAVGAAWGVFFFQMGNLNKIETEVAASVALAATFFAIFLFVLSILGLGILGILLSLIDAIFVLLGKKGPTQYVVEAIAGLLYDVDMSVANLDSSDRLDIQVDNLAFVDDQQGFRVSNGVYLTMGITNTIKFPRNFAGGEERVAKRNVFTYTLQTNPTAFTGELLRWDDTATDQWDALPGRYLRTNYQNEAVLPLSSVGAGLNRPLELYYREAFRSGYQGCWNTAGFGNQCSWKDFESTIHYPLGDMLTFDIFPETVTAFARMNWSDTAPPLPQQVDGDFDGLIDTGGDPDQEAYDMDGDGLSDFFEVSNGYDATVADGDFDGLNDKQELAHGTNPFVADTDGDGLNDRIEVLDGWLITYDESQLTRVWSDPLSADTDEDGLDDLHEFIFGFNPWTATDPSLITQLVQFDDLGVVESGAPQLLLRFEEAVNSTAFADSSGEGHHATCTGDTCPSVSGNGRYAQALSFDGVDDYIDTASIIDPAATNFTIAMWFKVNNFSNAPILVQQLDGSGAGRPWLGVTSDGRLGSYIYASPPATGITSVTAGKWHHAAMTYDGELVRWYLDGVLQNNDLPPASNDGGFRFGGHQDHTNANLDGSLDDVVLFTKALSTAELEDLMAGRFNPDDNLLAAGSDLQYQATVTNTSSTTATGFLVAENSYFEPALRHPAAAYAFEPEQRLAYFVNNTGGGSSVVCVDNGTCPAQVAGRYDTGLWLNGATHTTRLPAMSVRTFGDQFNLSLWVDLNQYPASGERMMLVDTESEEPGAIDIYINSSGNVVVDIAGHPNGPGVDSRVLDLNWNHISLNGHYQLFINGSGQVLNSWSSNPPDSYQIGPGTLGNSLDGSAPFHGRLDELVFFNDFRDSANNEINAIRNGNYSSNTQLFRFNQLVSYDGTIFYDSQSGSNHATCSGDTCPTLTAAGEGYSGRAAVLDGVDDFMVQPGNFTGSEPTITFYMNPADYPTAGNRAYIYDTEAVGSGTTLTFDLYLDENGQLTLDYGSGSTTYNTVIPQNQWSKIQVVFDRFSSSFWEYRVYLKVDNVQDGAYAGICAGSGACSYTARVGNGRIGNNLAGDAPFAGMLDQLQLKISRIDFDPPTVNVGYDNLANQLRSANCPDVFACPDVGSGRYGSGLSLDGVDDYLVLDTPLDPAREPFSAALWFMTTGYGNEPIFLQQADGTGTGRTWLGIRSDGRLYTYLGGSFLNGTSTISPDTWHHAAVTYDGTTLRLYLDGVEEAASVRTLEASDGTMELGRHKSFADRYFTGQLDELIVLPTAVTPAKVQLLMNSQWPMIDIPAEFVPFSTTALTSQEVSGLAPVNPYATTSVHRFDQEVEAALVLQAQIDYPIIDNNAADLEMYLPFEDAPGTTVFDNLISYPNGFADPDLEAPCASAATCPTAGLRGQVGRAAYFDGRDDYLLLDAEYLSGSGPAYIRGVSVWVNAEQGTILDIDREASGTNRTLDIRLDRILTSNDGSTVQTLAYDAPRNEWFHLAVSIDGSQGTVYVNGSVVATGPLTLDAGWDNHLEHFNVGANNSGHNLLQGYLDDFRLYSTPLTQADVTALYETSAPLLRFEFDEDEAATVFVDNSINQYVGRPRTITRTVAGETVSQPSPAPGTEGRIGNGALFDGQSYVRIDDADDPAALTNDLAIMAWIRPETVSAGTERLFGAGNEATVNGYNLAIDNGKLLFQTNGIEQYLSDVTIEPDKWQHIAVVFDSSNDAHFYLDGEFQQTVTGSSPANANTDDPLYIGARTDINGNLIQAYTGMIDELAVYGRSLTTAELTGIYLRELRWYRDKATTYLTIDTDNPTIELLSDAAYWPAGYTQLAVATTDATSAVSLLDFGLKAPGATEFTWQGAPPCAESSGAGAAWCPYFDSTQLADEGVYELQFRAVDAVGNETVSSVYTLYVDGTAPTAAGNYTGQWVQPTVQNDADLQWTIALNGTLADPDLATTPPVAGSGLVTNTVLVQLLDGAGGVVSEGPQLATVTGSTWAIDYQMSGTRPQGTYAVVLTLADQVGNEKTITVGTVRLDERPPAVDIDNWNLPGEVISQTLVLSGTAQDLPDWGGSVVEHHFEEPAGTTIFYNTASSQFYTTTHSTCTSCPTAGQAGLFGNGVQFDGVDDRIDVPFVINPSTEAFAASVWFNLTDLNDTRSILQQLDGNGTGRTWLYVESSNGKLQSHLGGSALVGATPVTVGEWHHAAVTYDGTTLRLYLDGRLEASEDRGLEGADGDMQLGVNKFDASRFQGTLDEFTLYDRALSAQEVYALAQQEMAGVAEVAITLESVDFSTDAATTPSNWVPATVAPGNPGATDWQYPLPSDLEGFYEIYLRSRDAFDNQGRSNAVWRGLIDTVSPVITATGQQQWDNNDPVTEYSFTFSDFLLDDGSYVQPCDAGALVSQTYDDANLPQDGQPYEVTATCRVPGHETSRTFTACDAAGNCTDEIVQPTSAPLVTDVNGDGCVNQDDVTDVAGSWRAVSGDDLYDPALDVNSDGVINTLDVMQVVSDMGNGC